MPTIKNNIVVIRDSADDQAVVNVNTPKNLISRTAKPDSATKILARGRVELWAHHEISAIALLKQIGEDINNYEIVNVLNSTDMYFAFSKDVDDSVVQLLQKGIDMVKQ
jgi:polar amino acid transport system substrate-binding protein